MASPAMRERFRFHHEHGGSIVGEQAVCALAAARAELLLEQAEGLGVAELRWEYDDEPYEHGVLSDAEVARLFEAGTWTGPYGAVLEVNGAHAASCWGIVLNSRGLGDPYARAMAAELSLEAADELRRAIVRAVSGLRRGRMFGGEVLEAI